MESSRDYAYYKEHAQDVNLGDISSSERNKNIMQKLRDGDSDFTSFLILDEPMDDDDLEFMVQEDADDLGWLGYFIGENKTLNDLLVKCHIIGNSLIEGICRNRSIESLAIENDVRSYLPFGRMFKNNSTLNSLTFECFRMNARELAVSLGQRSQLKYLNFDNMDFSDEDVSAIAKALVVQPQLEELKFEWNEFERDCCVALKTTFMEWGSDSQLKKLDLSCDGIEDEGLTILLEGLACCHNLVDLNLSCNTDISAQGLRGLSSHFQNGVCCLEILNLHNVQIDDNGAEALAFGLMHYESLKFLDLSRNLVGDAGVAALVSGLTAAANANLETLNLADNHFSTAGIWSLSALIQSTRSSLKQLGLDNREVGADEAREQASILANALRYNTSMRALDLDYNIRQAGKEFFSKLLCDTSSINNIYSSNHTLQSIRSIHGRPDEGKYFDLNYRRELLEPDNCALVPMLKILINYPDLAEMEPFYQWKLMFLPMIASWFQRASDARGYFEESVEEFQRREVSALYKFIRGVPLLVADSYWGKQLKQVRLKKRKLEEEEKQLLKRFGRGKRAST